MSNVVALRTRQRIKADTSPAFESAWTAFPETGRLRSSRRQAWPVWCAVAREIGEDDLADRVARYAREDKEHRRECGAPGFHRWLSWGRWEHWGAVAATAPLLTVVPVFPEETLRKAFFDRFSDDRARRWFDRCKFDAEKREVIDAPPARTEWLSGPFSSWAKLHDVRGVVFNCRS